MSWWGTIIGGAMGWAVGGPLGMLLGGALGRNFDRGVQNVSTQRGTEHRQIIFYTATFSVMGHLCKADGQVSKTEIHTARQIMRQMSLNEDMQRLAIKLFEQGTSPKFSLAQTMRQLRGEIGHQPNVYRMFVEIQILAAYADGKMHAAENRILLEICELLGIPRQEFEHLCVMLGGNGARDRGPVPGELTSERAYQILGVSREASDKEMTRAYRRLMSRHHPDKLIAKGLPEEMIKVATERTGEIRKAYEWVKASRNL